MVYRDPATASDERAHGNGILPTIYDEEHQRPVSSVGRAGDFYRTLKRTVEIIARSWVRDPHGAVFLPSSASVHQTGVDTVLFFRL